ncbi:hypothetical protein Tco_1472021, partial [Tanacetum coccineum]
HSVLSLPPDKGMSSSVLTFFSLPPGDEFFLEAETFLFSLAGDKRLVGSFMVTPYKVSALIVELDFKIDLIVLVTEESVTITVAEGSVISTCDSEGRILQYHD